MMNSIACREKEVLAIQRELRKLRNAKWNLGSYELPKPIRHGWYKHFRLRDDIARRRDAKVFQNVLDVAGMKIWGRDKKHMEKVWAWAMRRDPRVLVPGIYKLDKKRYRSLLPAAQKYFEGFELNWTYWRGSHMEYHCRVPSYFFVPTSTKAYITHRKIIDAQLEMEISELEGLLLLPKYYALDNYSYRNHWRSFIGHKRDRRKVKMGLSKVSIENYEEIIWEPQSLGQHDCW